MVGPARVRCSGNTREYAKGPKEEEKLAFKRLSRVGDTTAALFKGLGHATGTL